MATATARELARSAVADRRWLTAARLFAEADRSTAGGALTGSDLEQWSTALFLRGERDDATETMSRAHEMHLAHGDTVGAARAANAAAVQLLEAGDVAQSGFWMARGTRLAEHLDELIVARVSLVPAAIVAGFVGDLDDALHRFEHIAEVADRHGDVELAAHAAFGRARSLKTIGRWAEGFASLDRSMRAVSVGQVSPTWICLFCRIALSDAYDGFDLDRAERWTRDFAHWCDAQPELLAYTGLLHAYRAQLALLHGEWTDAAAAADLADQAHRQGDFAAGYVAPYFSGELQRKRGALRAAEALYRRAGGTGWDPQPGLALTVLARGEVGGAQAMLRRSVLNADPGDLLRLLPAVVQIELAAGDRAAARSAADDLATRAGSAPPVLLAAVVSFAVAQVLHAEDRDIDALAALAEAQSAFTAVNAPYEVARCRMLRGSILLPHDETAARAELAAARARFADLGAQPDIDAVDAFTGERAAGALTPREIEVLRLVATGLSNRGIAERLSLSEKTIARHLSNIYAKLRVSSRSAATAYAYQHGLV